MGAQSSSVAVAWREAAEVLGRGSGVRGRGSRGLNRQVQGHLLHIERVEEVGDARVLLSAQAEVEGRGEADEALPKILGESPGGRRGRCWRRPLSFLGWRRANRTGTGVRGAGGIV